MTTKKSSHGHSQRSGRIRRTVQKPLIRLLFRPRNAKIKLFFRIYLIGSSTVTVIR